MYLVCYVHNVTRMANHFRSETDRSVRGWGCCMKGTQDLSELHRACSWDQRASVLLCVNNYIRECLVWVTQWPPDLCVSMCARLCGCMRLCACLCVRRIEAALSLCRFYRIKWSRRLAEGGGRRIQSFVWMEREREGGGWRGRKRHWQTETRQSPPVPLSLSPSIVWLLDVSKQAGIRREGGKRKGEREDLGLCFPSLSPSRWKCRERKNRDGGRRGQDRTPHTHIFPSMSYLHTLYVFTHHILHITISP